MADGNDTPATGVVQQSNVDPSDALGDAGLRALQAERKRAREAEQKLRALQKELDDTLGTATFNGKDLFEADGTKFTFQVNAESGDTFDVDIGGMSTQGLGVEAAARSGKVFANGKLSAITVAAAGTYAADTKVDKSFEIEITGVDTSDVNPDNHTITYKVDGGSETTDTIANLAAVAIDGDATNGLHVNFGANGLTAADYKVGQKITVKYDNLALNVTGNTNASTSLSTIDSAISSISKELANLGDAQNRLSFKQENLQTSMNNYEAARSRIIDADFAKEQMEIVKLQILQQTGTAALAQANVAPQAVLSLLGGQ